MLFSPGFLDLPLMNDIITDSHFAQRDRMGRLLAFMARLRQDKALQAHDYVHDVAPQIPGCEVCDLPGVGHSAYFEDAPAFNKVVDAYLSQHAGR